jgi:hypothetical protein
VSRPLIDSSSAATEAAEVAVLGGLLLDNTARTRLNGLAVEHFASERNRIVFTAICDALDDEGAADAVSVFQRLSRNGDAERAGGLPYLNDLAANTPSAANVERYAKLVQRAARDRKVRSLLEQAGDAAQRGDIEGAATLAAQIAEHSKRPTSAPGLPDLVDRIRHLPDDWTTRQPPPHPHVIRPFYPRGCVSTLLGTGGVSKTLLVCEQATAITLGEDWRGHLVEEGDVVIMTWEDGLSDYHAKLHALAAARTDWRDQASRIRERLHFLDLRATLLRLVAGNEYGKPSPTMLAHRFVELARERFPDLRVLFVETVSRANGCDETNEALAAMVAAAEIIATELDIAVVLVHHVSKAAARAGLTDAMVGRGGGALVDNARASTIVALLGVSDEADRALLPNGMSACDLEGREVLLVANAHTSYARRAAPIYLERVYTAGDSAPHLIPLVMPELGATTDRQAARLSAEDEALLGWLQRIGARGWMTERAITDRRAECGLSERATRAALARLAEGGALRSERGPQYGDRGRAVTRYAVLSDRETP